MRLIDADELIVLEYEGIEFVPREFIDDAPSIEPQIIHCKDCIFYEHDMGECDHKFGLMVADKDSFCSLAERKDNG